MAQPAVSVQIRRLEAEVGAMAELDAIRDEFAGPSGGLLAHVRIGAIQALDPFDLPAALAAFHRRHPAVELALSSGALRRLLDGLDHGELDLASPRRSTPSPAPIPCRWPRCATNRSCACSPTAILDRLAAEAGFAPHVPFESTHLPSPRDLAAHGRGVALVARSVARQPVRRWPCTASTPVRYCARSATAPGRPAAPDRHRARRRRRGVPGVPRRLDGRNRPPRLGGYRRRSRHER